MEENVAKKVKKGPTYFELKKQVKDLTMDMAKAESDLKDAKAYEKTILAELDHVQCVNYQLKKEKDMMAEQMQVLSDELERMRRRSLWERLRNK